MSTTPTLLLSSCRETITRLAITKAARSGALPVEDGQLRLRTEILQPTREAALTKVPGVLGAAGALWPPTGANLIARRHGVPQERHWPPTGAMCPATEEAPVLGRQRCETAGGLSGSEDAAGAPDLRLLVRVLDHRDRVVASFYATREGLVLF